MLFRINVHVPVQDKASMREFKSITKALVTWIMVYPEVEYYIVTERMR